MGCLKTRDQANKSLNTGGKIDPVFFKTRLQKSIYALIPLLADSSDRGQLPSVLPGEQFRDLYDT